MQLSFNFYFAKIINYMLRSIINLGLFKLQIQYNFIYNIQISCNAISWASFYYMLWNNKKYCFVQQLKGQITFFTELWQPKL